MITIKNISSLDEAYKVSFKRFYASFFRHILVERDVKFRMLSKMKLIIRAENYVDDMLWRLENGEVMGFMAFELVTQVGRTFIRPVGLIVGSDEGGINNLVHFYVDKNMDPSSRLLVMRDLLATYSSEAKNNTSQKIEARGDESDNRLIDDLESMQFTLKPIKGTGLHYEKLI